MEDSDHAPNAPFWDCKTCGDEWPCDPAKAQMSAEYAGYESSLIVYLGMMRSRALEDFYRSYTDVPPDMDGRFLSWVQRPDPWAKETARVGA